MRNSILVIVAATIALAGCAPKVARRPLTEQEKQWSSYVKGYYPSWKPATTVAAGIQPNASGVQIQPVITSKEVLPPMPEDSASDLVFVDDSAMVGGEIIDITEVETTEVVVEEAKVETETVVEESKVEAEVIAPAEPEYTEYVVKKNDMLSSLAQKFYGKASLWPVIQKANEDVLKGKEQLTVGMKLRIPKR